MEIIEAVSDENVKWPEADRSEPEHAICRSELYDDLVTTKIFLRFIVVLVKDKYLIHRNIKFGCAELILIR